MRYATNLPPLRSQAAVVQTTSLDPARPAAADLLALAVDAAQDIKARGIVSIDLRQVEDSPTEFFLVCEGESAVQVRAIAENVRRRAREELGQRTTHVEGTGAANWVCLDYFDTVVHVFSREARQFYDLEGLWSDAPTTHYEDL